MSKMPFARCQRVFPINGLILVGVCAAGKSTIAQLLRPYGIVAHSIAQEHSQSPSLFLHHGLRPVVVLSANFSTIRRRRRLQWTFRHYQDQWQRLILARSQAHLIIRTDPLTPWAVAREVVTWFDTWTGLNALWEQRHIAEFQQQTLIRYQVTWGVRLSEVVISAGKSGGKKFLSPNVVG